MQHKLLLTLTGVALALTLAACGGGGGGSSNPSGPCTLPSQVQMIYPIPGATNVPDAPQQFVFAESAYLPGSWNAFVNNTNSLNGSASTVATVQNISASQVPQPSATPSMANPVYQSISLQAGFASQQTIYAWLNDTASSCTPTGPVGSFKTQ